MATRPELASNGQSAQKWSVPSRFSEGNESGVEFLLSELDLAVTFMDFANTTTNEETAQRNYQHAIKAYKTAERFLPKVMPDRMQRQTIAEKLANLRARLDGAGYQV